MSNAINLAINAKDNATRVVSGLNRSLVALAATANRTTQAAKGLGSSFNSSFSSAAGSVSRISSSMAGLSTQIKGVASSMSMLTAGLGAVAGKSVSIGVDFEDNIQKLKATIFTVTDADMSKLEAQARYLGKTTRFTAGQAAQAQTFLAQAGWSTQQILDGMKSTLALAASSGVAIERASEIISKVSVAFEIPAKNAFRVADVLSLTASKTNVNLEELAETMKYAAPIAKTFGLSIEQASALAGKMGDVGVAGSEAGTAMRAGLARLASPPKMARDWMQKLNLSVIDTKGNMRQMGDIIADLEFKTSKLNQAQRIEALRKIFGLEAVSAWAGVLSQGNGMYSKLVGALNESQGVALKKAEIMEDSLGGTFRTLRSMAEDVAITITKLMKPSIEKVVDVIMKALKAFDAMNKKTQRTILLYLGVAAAIGPVLAVFGALVGAISMLLTPLGLVASGFAFLATSMLVAGVKSKRFRDRVAEVFGTLQREVFGSSVSTREALTMLTRFMVKVAFKVLDVTEIAIKKTAAFWRTYGEAIKSTLVSVAKFVAKFAIVGFQILVLATKAAITLAINFWERYGDRVTKILTFIGTKIDQLSKMSPANMKLAFDQMMENVKSKFVPVLTAMAFAVDGATKLIESLWRAHAENFKSIFASLFEITKGVFKSFFDNIFDFVSTFIVAIETVLRENSKTIIGIFDFVFTLITQVVMNAMPVVTDILKNAFNFINEVFVKNKDSWIEIITFVVTGILSLFNYLFETVISIIEPALVAILEFWTKHKDEIIATVMYLVGILKQLFEESLSVILELVMYMLQSIADFFVKNKDDIILVVTELVDLIRQAWEYLGPVVKFLVKFAFDIVVGIIQSALDIIVGLVKIFKGAFTGDWSLMFEGVVQFVKGFVLTVLTFFSGPLFSGLGKIVGGGLTKLASAFGGKFATIADGLKMAFSGVFSWLGKAFEGTMSFISKLIKGALDGIDWLITQINKVPGVNMGKINFGGFTSATNEGVKAGAGVIAGGAASAAMNRKPVQDTNTLYNRANYNNNVNVNVNSNVLLDSNKVGSAVGQNIVTQTNARAGF